MSKEVQVLVVDDDRIMRENCVQVLTVPGYRVDEAPGGAEALGRIREREYDVVVTDLKMPGMDGVQLMRLAREVDPSIECIIMTAHGNVENAVEAMKLGAFDYVMKPFNIVELRHLVANASDKKRLKTEVNDLRRNIKRKYRFENLIGTSEPMQQVYRLIEKVSRSNANVVVQGESGTGKELVAKAIHYNSDRASRPFVVVNCGAISQGLLESELFGYVRGAFTGAHRDRIGYFEAADGGTIFLDEIAEVIQDLQVKLLRVIQEREVVRVGDTVPRKIDVRIIAASNRNLDDEVGAGRFRNDLFYRLNVVTISLPPLRDRMDDVPLLVKEFLVRFAKEQSRSIDGVAREAMAVLTAYGWPGNVRELENTIERAVTLTGGPEITVEDLPSRLADQARSGGSPGRWILGAVRPVSLNAQARFSFKDAKQRLMDAFDVDALSTALKATHGNISNAAHWLSLGRNAMHKLIRKYGINVAEFRASRPAAGSTTDAAWSEGTGGRGARSGGRERGRESAREGPEGGEPGADDPAHDKEERR